MKIKILAVGLIMLAIAFVFVACGKAEDGKITTTAPNTTTSRVETTTKKTIKDEMSSLADDVSDGLSEAGSDLKKGITRIYE